MKRSSIIYSKWIGAGLLAILLTLWGAGNSKGGGKTYDDPHIGSMHPHIVSEGPGTCSECGMGLSRLEGHRPGTVLQPLSNIYASPDSPMWVHEGPGNDPNTGNALIPIAESSIYQPPAEHDHGGGSSADHGDEQHEAASGTLYTCGMHPDVIQEEPGTCPLCGMNLTPIKRPGASAGGQRKAAYWTAPMDPNYISDMPGKSPMGMDLVPVYEDEVSETIVWIDPATIQNIGVTTSEVEKRDLTVSLRTNGIVTIAEDNEYRVNPKISGWIEKLYVNRTGDLVEKGDPLLEIYSPQLVAAQEEFLLALGNVELLRQSQIERVKVSADNLLKSARRRLELWDISAAQIENLETTGIVKRTMIYNSPISGTVLHKNAVEGAAVKAGVDLFRIVDLTSVWVEAQIFEHEMPWLSLGGGVKIESPYDPSLSLTGKVDYIYPYMDAKTRTAKIRIIIQNPHLELRQEMYVDVIIDAQSSDNAVAVHKNAVIRSGVRDIVFVDLGDGRFMPREVKLGLETDRFYEVVDGLTSGTTVVTSAQFLLDSEAKLQEAIQRRLKARRDRKL